MTSNNKIGGWLILLGLQMLITTLIAGYGLKNYFILYTSSDWSNVTSNLSLDELKMFFYTETSLFLYLLIGSTTVITIFINRRSNFRDYYIIYMIISIIGYLITYLVAARYDKMTVSKLTEITSALFSYLIWTIIWSLYLFKSVRAKQTFVN